MRDPLETTVASVTPWRPEGHPLEAGSQKDTPWSREWRSPRDGRLVARQERPERWAIVLLFGQHNRKRLGEVPAAYLAWMLEADWMLPLDLRLLAGAEIFDRLPATVQQQMRDHLSAGRRVEIPEYAFLAPDRNPRLATADRLGSLSHNGGEVRPPAPGEPGAWAWRDDEEARS